MALDSLHFKKSPRLPASILPRVERMEVLNGKLLLSPPQFVAFEVLDGTSFLGHWIPSFMMVVVGQSNPLRAIDDEVVVYKT